MLKFAQTERIRPLQEERVSPEGRSRKKQRMQRNGENSEKKVEIVVDCREPEKEEVVPEKEGVKLLFEKFDLLKKADEDFNSFLEVVSKDIVAKTDRLKKVKVSGRAGISDRTDANVQLFMLGQYRHRIARFQNVANSSLLSISSALENGKEVSGLVEKHMAIVGKMKRRMKQMLDVTEKYAVEDIFDTINLLQQMSNKIKLSPIEGEEERVSRLTRRSQSLTVLGVDSIDGPSRTGGSKDVPQHSFSSSSSRRSLSPLRPSKRGSIGEGGGGVGGGGRKMNTFKT